MPSVMKRPRRPIMSTMRMRRSEWRLTNSATSNGRRIRDENDSRRSLFENPATYVKSSALTPHQMNPHRTLKNRMPKKTSVSRCRVTS